MTPLWDSEPVGCAMAPAYFVGAAVSHVAYRPVGLLEARSCAASTGAYRPVGLLEAMSVGSARLAPYPGLGSSSSSAALSQPANRVPAGCTHEPRGRDA
jgi:hypothetical protein